MKNKKVVLGTLYDFNKQIISKSNPITNKEIEKIKFELAQWFNDFTIAGYAMLLCRERYDFTIFHLYEQPKASPQKNAANELIEVLKNRGTILSIEKDVNTINNSWEIWIKIDNEVYAYYLFVCDDWVIEC